MFVAIGPYECMKGAMTGVVGDRWYLKVSTIRKKEKRSRGRHCHRLVVVVVVEINVVVVVCMGGED